MLSWFIKKSDNLLDSLDLNGGKPYAVKDLVVQFEEAGCEIISHTVYSLRREMNRIIVGSNDTDVAVYLIYFFRGYLAMGCFKLWVTYGAGYVWYEYQFMWWAKKYKGICRQYFWSFILLLVSMSLVKYGQKNPLWKVTLRNIYKIWWNRIIWWFF